MSFNCNFEYNYIFKSDFNPNISIVSKIYMPFLSKNAFCLYSYMCEEVKNFSSVKFFKNKIKEIVFLLGMTNEEFQEAKESLEAYGLLKTFLSKDQKIYFEIFEPLKIQDFLSNKMLVNNLKTKIGDELTNKIISQYSENMIYSELEDITIDQDCYFEKNNLKNKNDFDFEKLFKNISLVSKSYIYFSDEVKNEINNFYKNYKLSENEIEKCVYSAIVSSNDGYIVDLNLIQKELSDLTSKDLNEIKTIVKLNHNKKIFIEKSSIETLTSVFNNYKNFNSEQFLSLISLEDLTDENRKIIKLLRTKYNFADFLINIMIDYSIRKTHGSLNEKYITKMAKSFFINSIESLDEAYEFLLNWDNKNESSKKIKEIVEQKHIVKNEKIKPVISHKMSEQSLFDVEEDDNEICLDISDLNILG